MKLLFNKQSGFSLVEVLIGLIMFSIALLGLAKLEISALRYNHAAYLASIAEMQLSGLIECMQLIKSSRKCCAQSQVGTSLPKGKCAVSLSGGRYQIIIGWDESLLGRVTKNCSAKMPESYNCLSATGYL